jgi:hypothetical protein
MDLSDRTIATRDEVDRQRLELHAICRERSSASPGEFPYSSEIPAPLLLGKLTDLAQATALLAVCMADDIEAHDT